MWANLILKIVIINLPDNWSGDVKMTYLLLFLNGLLTIPRLGAGTIYMCEFFPRASQSFRIALWLAVDTGVIFVISISYW